MKRFENMFSMIVKIDFRREITWRFFIVSPQRGGLRVGPNPINKQMEFEEIDFLSGQNCSICLGFPCFVLFYPAWR